MTSFDQVYQDGHASRKQIIVRYPRKPSKGKWYIIQCQECDLDFGDKPLVVAGSHLYSSTHNHGRRDANSVIVNFGIEVSGCNEQLAKKNNAAARLSFPKKEQTGRQRGKTSAGDNQQIRRSVLAVRTPEPGGVYLGKWGKRGSKKSYAVLVLPTSNPCLKLHHIGI